MGVNVPLTALVNFGGRWSSTAASDAVENLLLDPILTLELVLYIGKYNHEQYIPVKIEQRAMAARLVSAWSFIPALARGSIASCVASGRYSAPPPSVRSRLDSTDEALRALHALAVEANTWPAQRSADLQHPTFRYLPRILCRYSWLSQRTQTRHRLSLTGMRARTQQRSISMLLTYSTRRQARVESAAASGRPSRHPFLGPPSHSRIEGKERGAVQEGRDMPPRSMLYDRVSDDSTWLKTFDRQFLVHGPDGSLFRILPSLTAATLKGRLEEEVCMSR